MTLRPTGKRHFSRASLSNAFEPSMRRSYGTFTARIRNGAKKTTIPVTPRVWTAR